MDEIQGAWNLIVQLMNESLMCIKRMMCCLHVISVKEYSFLFHLIMAGHIWPFTQMIAVSLLQYVESCAVRYGLLCHWIDRLIPYLFSFTLSQVCRFLNSCILRSIWVEDYMVFKWGLLSGYRDGHHCQVNPQWMILMLMIGFFGFLSYEVLQYVSIYVQQVWSCHILLGTTTWNLLLMCQLYLVGGRSVLRCSS